MECTFTQNITKVPTTEAKTLLYARGTAVFQGTAVSRLIKHPSGNTFVSKQAVSVEQSVNLSAEKVKKPMVVAHGCLMIAAWAFFSSLGIIAARYYKPVWKELLFSQKVWFQIHRTCMILVFCTTAAGFVIIFVEVKDWSDVDIPDKEYLKGHPIMGVIVMGLTLTNPIMALFRPHPGTPKRPIFNWAHWFVGESAQILSIVTIFFGLQLYDAPDYLTYIMAGFTAWYFLVEIFLVCAQCACKNQDKREVYEMGDDGKPKAAPGEESGQIITVKKAVLVLHFLVVTSLTAVLIGLLVKESDL